MENNVSHAQSRELNGHEATLIVASSTNSTIATYEGALNPFEAHKSEDDEEASLGAEDSEDKHILPVADEHGNPIHYPGEDEHNYSEELDDKAKVAPRSVIAAGLESFKYIYFFALLIFSIVIVTWVEFSRGRPLEWNKTEFLLFLPFHFLIFDCLVGHDGRRPSVLGGLANH